MSLTIALNRSDLFPVGTVVEAFANQPARPGRKPAGAALASATVDATGTLTFSTLPEKRSVLLWAANGAFLATGDPTRDVFGLLSARLRRSRVRVA